MAAVGGPGGEEFDDEPFIAPSDFLLRVLVRAGWYVDSVQAVLVGDDRTVLEMGVHGGTGGEPTSFDLERDQFLKALEVYYGPEYTHGLRFTTNKRTSNWFGRQDGSLKKFEAPEGKEIVGFNGRAAHFLDAVGAVVRARPSGLRPIPIGGAAPPLPVEIAGGAGGYSFDDTQIVKPTDSVYRVLLRFAYYVDSVQMVVMDSDRQTRNLTRHGGGGGAGAIFELELFEYITAVEVFYGGDFVHGVRITTNLRTSRWFGRAEGQSAKWTAPDGQEICGFRGRSNFYLDALGVIYRPRSAPRGTPAPHLGPSNQPALGLTSPHFLKDAPVGSKSTSYKAFDDLGFLAGPDSQTVHVRRILVRAASRIISIETSIQVGSLVRNLPERGGSRGGGRSWVLIGLDAALRRVEGYYSSEDDCIVALRFVADGTESTWIGEQRGEHFKLEQAGKRIVGFHGSTDFCLRSIGVIYAAEKSSAPTPAPTSSSSVSVPTATATAAPVASHPLASNPIPAATPTPPPVALPWGRAAAAVQSEPPAGPPIEVINFSLGETVRHRLPIVRGRVGVPGMTAVRVTVGDSSVAWPVAGGLFKALVPLRVGPNDVKFETEGDGDRHVLEWSMEYEPQTNKRMIRLVYLLAKDGDGTFQAPDGEPSTLESAVARIKLAGLMMQSWTAEKIWEHGFPFRRTFNLLGDGNEVLLHRSELTLAQARGFDDDGKLYDHFNKELSRLPCGEGEDIINVAVMSMTEFDPVAKRARAHTALGGGHLGLFGSGNLNTWAETLEQVVTRFNDTVMVDSNRYFDDSAGRGTKWSNFSTGLGATLHELGHCLGLPHTAYGDSIMARGFDYINRTFMTSEPRCKGSSGLTPLRLEDETAWHRSSAVHLFYHPHLLLDNDPVDPDGKCDVECVDRLAGSTSVIRSRAGLRHVGYTIDGDIQAHEEWLEEPPEQFVVSAEYLHSLFPQYEGPVGICVMDDDGIMANGDAVVAKVTVRA